MALSLSQNRTYGPRIRLLNHLAATHSDAERLPRTSFDPPNPFPQTNSLLGRRTVQPLVTAAGAYAAASQRRVLFSHHAGVACFHSLRCFFTPSHQRAAFGCPPPPTYVGVPCVFSSPPLPRFLGTGFVPTPGSSANLHRIARPCVSACTLLTRSFFQDDEGFLG